MQAPSCQFTLEELKLINETIEQIYDEKLTFTELMMSFLNNLKEQLYFDKGNFLFYNYNEGNSCYEVKTFVPLGWDDDDIGKYIENYVRIDDVLPILSEKNNIAFRGEDIFLLRERKKTKYFQEFIMPSQLQNSIDANIVLPNGIETYAIMGFFRDFGKKGFSEKELELIKIYQPHLSVILNKHLTSEDIVSDRDLMHMIDSFESLGMCIIDDTFKIVSLDSTFKKFTENSMNTSVYDSDLSKKMLLICQELYENQSIDRLGPVEITIGEESYFIEVTQHRQPQNSSKFVCLIYSYSDFFLQRLTSIKNKYKLSNREFEIIYFMLKRGMSNDEIAKNLFISPSTVKKHVSSAYLKIDVRNQKQLLNVLKIT